MAKPVPIARQIACVERELRLRRGCYDRWVHQGKMTPLQREREVQAMEAVAGTLRMMQQLIGWAQAAAGIGREEGGET